MNWILWALLSAVFAATTAILANVGVAGVSSNIATAIRTSVVLVLAWLVVLFTKEIGTISTISRRTWIFLALSGIATGLSWLCYFRALQMGDASRVAAIDKLSVVFVVIFAVTFLSESFTFKTVLGALMIVGGALLLSRR
jgi:transporter family protein